MSDRSERIRGVIHNLKVGWEEAEEIVDDLDNLHQLLVMEDDGGPTPLPQEER